MGSVWVDPLTAHTPVGVQTHKRRVSRHVTEIVLFFYIFLLQTQTGETKRYHKEQNLQHDHARLPVVRAFTEVKSATREVQRGWWKWKLTTCAERLRPWTPTKLSWKWRRMANRRSWPVCHSDIYIYIYIYIHIQYIHTYIYIHIYIYVCMYIYIHTHICLKTWKKTCCPKQPSFWLPNKVFGS